MRRCQSLIFTSVGILFIGASAAAAQSDTRCGVEPCVANGHLKVMPAMPSAALGTTIQFTATITSMDSTAVTWSAGGVIGGNATTGTITPSGIYSAPATMPAQNPVPIVATSVANSAVKAATYVRLLSPGPSITSVSPNPLPLGAYTVTIQGTGFKPNATVNNGGIQLATTAVTATSVSATGWQGPATSATFTVKHPGSIASNAITVPVGSAGATSYTLTVVNGTGSGTYAAGAIANISANAPPAGKTFSGWSGATVGNASSSNTTITMPAANTTVTANYSAIPTYTLTVLNGSGSGTYTAGTVVNISANAPPTGKIFSGWSGATVGNASSSTTTITMPAANATVTANYSAVPTYTLTVVNGSGSGNYNSGAVVNISANAPPAGKTFSGWSGATVGNASSSNTTITMPAANVTVTANYSAVPTYTLTVVNGSGSGTYTAGTVVNISANAPPAGKTFSGWTGPTVGNTSSTSTTIAMPAANTTVTANYATSANNTLPTYTLTVVNGTGSGTYPVSAVVNISANAPPAGKTFSGWSGATVGNASSSSTTITMPAANTTVTASYSDGSAYTLTVVNGSGSGTYTAGTVVNISANAPPAGTTFSGWTGATVGSASSSSTTITMPSANTTVTANYSAVATNTPPTYTLTVVNGTGSGSYAAGAVVNISANAPPAGNTFSGWTGATVGNASSSSTTITMPAANTTVTANYSAVPTNTPPTYTLTVVNGTGSGTYAAGATVNISANVPPAGKTFSGWTGTTVGNASSSSTTITMPAANTTVTANYSAALAYTLTVVNGSGSGSYTVGTVVNISANAPPAGKTFSGWTGATVGDATSSSTTVTMPAANTTATASYATSSGSLLGILIGGICVPMNSGFRLTGAALSYSGGNASGNWSGGQGFAANETAGNCTY